MTKLIDVHAHLQFDAYNEDRESVIKENLEELEAIINVGADLESSIKAVELSKYNNLYASLGIHPHHAQENLNLEFISEFKKLINQEKVVAVGEIGLDTHESEGFNTPTLKEQTTILEAQLNLAQEYKKPIIFHCRDAYLELHEILKQQKNLKGLIHCFMGTYEDAKRFLDLGLQISFCGNLTYKKNGELREVVKKIPLENLLVETDAPYLTPEPLRGERNEPKYVKIVAALIASLKGIPDEKAFEILNQNSKKLFAL